MAVQNYANVTFLMLWLWTFALTCARPWAVALAYAALIALKPFWAALLVPWLLTRRLALAGRVLAMLAGLSLLPALPGPGAFAMAYGRWFATFADPLHAHNYPKADNQSWFGLLYRHADALPVPIPLLWLAGSVLLGLGWLWMWRRLARDGGVAELWQVELSFMPVILWAAPLSWIHHQILLWPLLAAVWQAGRTDRVLTLGLRGRLPAVDTRRAEPGGERGHGHGAPGRSAAARHAAADLVGRARMEPPGLSPGWS